MPDQSNQPPVVSVLIPCRNEKARIGACLESLLSCGYPHGRMEILVIDGRSHDGTAQIVSRYATLHPFIRLLENPAGITPAGLNIGLREAAGEFIMRMDAHAEVGDGYIARCLEAILKYVADNVGGPMETVPQKPTAVGRAIAATLSHPFGVGNSKFRTGSCSVLEVDTVFGGFYRRDIFRRIGGFNEHLERSQDFEFNLRLKEAGGRILMVPDIVSRYYARSSLRGYLEQNWNNGRWAVLACLRSGRIPLRWRHMMPGAVVVLGILLLLLAPFWATAGLLFLAACATYLLLALLASVVTAVNRKDSKLLVLMPVMFPALHVCYGAGTAFALLADLLLPATRSLCRQWTAASRATPR